MATFLVRDSEQNMQGQISHICTAKASLDGTIHWIVVHIIKMETPFDVPKIGMATIKAAHLKKLGFDVEVEEVTMDEHLKWLCRVISQSGYRLPLLGHSLDRDIEFMFKSADEFFDGNPMLFPGYQRKSWQRIIKVCTQRLIVQCCPNTHRIANPAGNPRSTLDHYIRHFLDRDQKHNAVDDVLDLVEILKIAQVHDNFKLPKENYMYIKPDNRVSTQAGTA